MNGPRQAQDKHKRHGPRCRTEEARGTTWRSDTIRVCRCWQRGRSCEENRGDEQAWVEDEDVMCLAHPGCLHPLLLRKRECGEHCGNAAITGAESVETTADCSWLVFNLDSLPHPPTAMRMRHFAATKARRFAATKMCGFSAQRGADSGVAAPPSHLHPLSMGADTETV